MADEVDRIVGRRLRERRLELGLTQAALAEALGVRFQQVQKYETAANRIAASRLWRTAMALDVPVEFFFRAADGTSIRATDGRPDCPYNGQMPVREYMEIAGDGL